MDSIEKASFLMGKSYTKTQEGAAHSSNVTMITGTATSDSVNGVVSVDLGGNTISANDKQAVDISTTCAVKAGDVVQVSVIGADGTAKSLLVTGVIAGGDRMNESIETASADASAAKETADVAQVAASNAQTVASNAQSTANAAKSSAATAQSTADTAKDNAAAAQSTANSASAAASDANKAAQNANSAASAAANVAQSAQQTANTTKTYFYNDSSGSHVRNQDSTSAGTRADIKPDGLHVLDQDDGKELASFTSSGASIGKDSEMHSRYSSDGVHFYEGGKSFPFSQIKPVTYKNEKYSAAVFTTAPDDISTDDGLYHSGATVDVTAINGTATDNTGVGRVMLTATTVQSAEPKEAYIEVFASNNNPNKASGGKTVEDTYINLVAEGVYVNSSPISEIGKIYRTTINYTTKTWAQGTWDKTLNLPAGTYIVLSGVSFSDTKTGVYRQYQLAVASGNCSFYPGGTGLYQHADNSSADAYTTVVQVVVATSSCSIRPYVHTYLADWKIPVDIIAVRIR